VRPADTVPVTGARVVLHRVGIVTQGPADSTPTDATGRFAFRYGSDTTATWLLSTRHAGIEYFSAPLPAGRPVAAPLDILVFDTASSAPALTRSRTLVVSAPDAGGRRTVVDWLSLANDGVLTRVGRDSLDPTWAAPLPAGAENPGLGDVRFSQFSPDAVAFRNDSVFVFAPLSPGDKELLLQYDLPRGRLLLELPVAPDDSVDVFLEEAGARSRTAGWAPADTQRFQGRTFHRWHRTGPAGRLALRLPGQAVDPRLAVALLVLALVAAFVAGSLRASRRRAAVRSPAAAPPATDPAAELAGEVARLDAVHAAAPDDPAYRAERERLMAALRAALAARRGRS
jgi:hypothetical protein